EDKRMEVEKMAGQAFLKAEEFRQLEVRVVAIQERCAVLTEEGTKRLEERFKETTSNLRKQNETQNKKLEQAQTRYTALEEKMREALKDKVDEIEAMKRGGNEELHKAEVQVAALQEKLKAQEAALHQTQGRYGGLQKASATLADELTTAQNSLDEARQEMLKRAQDSLRLMKLCERIEKDQARAEEERLQREKERSMGEDEKVLELKLLVERLQSEKGTLEQRSATLRARYDRNELNDDEKTFAEWLMGLARSLHDEEDVVKDNELRRGVYRALNPTLQKDNLVQQHLAKIRQLESGLAHLIKEKEELSGGTNKSMIDLNAFMTSSPSPCTSPCTSDIASAPPPAPPAPVKSIPAVANSAVPPAPAPAPVVPKVKLTPIVKKAMKPPTPRKTIGLSFSSLDESDSEEDIPLSEVSAAAKSKTVLGKRERVPSPAKPQPEIVNAVTTANMTANPRTRELKEQKGFDWESQEYAFRGDFHMKPGRLIFAIVILLSCSLYITGAPVKTDYAQPTPTYDEAWMNSLLPQGVTMQEIRDWEAGMTGNRKSMYQDALERDLKFQSEGKQMTAHDLLALQIVCRGNRFRRYHHPIHNPNAAKADLGKIFRSGLTKEENEENAQLFETLDDGDDPSEEQWKNSLLRPGITMSDIRRWETSLAENYDVPHRDALRQGLIDLTAGKELKPKEFKALLINLKEETLSEDKILPQYVTMAMVENWENTMSESEHEIYSNKLDKFRKSLRGNSSNARLLKFRGKQYAMARQQKRHANPLTPAQKTEITIWIENLKLKEFPAEAGLWLSGTSQGTHMY
ncbi:hypothetical protein H0H93_006038, partial [Arthromyces matolae]